MKKKLITSEEFDITKLVLQLLLILTGGFIFLGAYYLLQIVQDLVLRGALFMLLGVVVAIIFILTLVKEYEIEK